MKRGIKKHKSKASTGNAPKIELKSRPRRDADRTMSQVVRCSSVLTRLSKLIQEIEALL